MRLPVEANPSRPIQGQIKRAVQEVMPILKLAHVQNISDQAILRTEYYWQLLAEFRTYGLPFLVAYRTSTVDTALQLDNAQRLRGSGILPWVTMTKVVEFNITDWFDALEGGKGCSDLDQMIKSIVAPSKFFADMTTLLPAETDLQGRCDGTYGLDSRCLHMPT